MQYSNAVNTSPYKANIISSYPKNIGISCSSSTIWIGFRPIIEGYPGKERHDLNYIKAGFINLYADSSTDCLQTNLANRSVGARALHLISTIFGIFVVFRLHVIPFSFFNVYRNTRKLSSHVRYLKSIEVQGCTSFIVFRNESIAQLVPLWTNLHVNIFAGTPLVNGRARATSYQLSAHSLMCLSLNNYFFHWSKESKNLGFWIPGSEIWVLDSNLK